MTIAQRLQAAQTQKSVHHLSPSPHSLPAARASNSTIGTPSSTNISSGPPAAMSRTSSEPWDFDLLERPKSSLTRLASPSHSNPSADTNRPSAHAKKDSWGIEPLSDLNNDQTAGLVEPQFGLGPQNGLIAIDSSSDSLLGDEFGPLEDCSERLGAIALEDAPLNDDDILGLLGAPVDHATAQRINHQAAEVFQDPPHPGPSSGRAVRGHHDRREQRSLNRSGSPPPHVLGQVVEIGFPLAQSRRALLETRNPTTGEWDVSAAVESLLGSPSQSATPRNPIASPPPDPESHRRPPSRSTSSSFRAQENGHRNPDPGTALSAVNAKEIQDQAAELLAQASAYGSTALGKAASFWKQSKASLTKVIEDQTAPRAPGGSKNGEAVKPKWMRDAQASSPTSDSITASMPFSDGEPGGSARRAPPVASDGPVPGSRQPYVSSARRKVVERSIRTPLTRAASPSLITPQSHPDSSSSAQDDHCPFAEPQSRRPSPPRSKPLPSFDFPLMPIVTATQQQISRSASFRAQGNDMFKQGQYGNAESAYSKALDAFQEGSTASQGSKVYFGCLPLYNNRAAARLKNGDGKGAREDVERVIGIVFCEDSALTQSAEYLCKRLEASGGRVPAELKDGLDVAEQVGKALSRRARIKEESEKWAEARADWEACRTLGGGVAKGAGGMRIVAEGAARCQKALAPEVTVSRPSTKPPPLHKAPLKPSRSAAAAVQKLRDAHSQAEAEANEKLEAKDMVDDKILAWKTGKETNLRALLASLDQVLWSGLEWKKVGMGELLTDGQVKAKYVRAISKVHPDKVPKEAGIVEQMIAKSVFATLNEAWISMQS